MLALLTALYGDVQLTHNDLRATSFTLYNLQTYTNEKQLPRVIASRATSSIGSN